MNTEIFESYELFLQRKDKKQNGVSPEYAKINVDYLSDNETEEGCWNCGTTTIEDLRSFVGQSVEFVSDTKGVVIGKLLGHSNFNLQVRLEKVIDRGPRRWGVGDTLTFTIGRVSDMKLYVPPAPPPPKFTPLSPRSKPAYVKKAKGTIVNRRNVEAALTETTSQHGATVLSKRGGMYYIEYSGNRRVNTKLGAITDLSIEGWIGLAAELAPKDDALKTAINDYQ